MNLNAGNLETLLSGYVLLHLLAQAAGELKHLAAIKAQQVMMVSGLLGLVVVMRLAEVQLLHQPQLLERLQVAVNGGQAETGLALAGNTVDRIGIQMATRLFNDIQN